MAVWKIGRGRAAGAAAATILFTALAAEEARAQAPYTAGDRVECNITGMTTPQYEHFYEPGTIEPFRPGDGPDGSWYRFKADSNGVEYPCRLNVLRRIGPAVNAQTAVSTPRSTTRPTVARPVTPPTPPRQPVATTAAGTFLDCPVRQPRARNGSAPSRAIIEQVIRCAKGERGVPPGEEGAVRVQVSAVQVGSARPWTYSQDQGNGQAGTTVYPVRATYTVTTIYRAADEVEADWMRVLNFYVNAFGEWDIGSEEPVRAPTVRRIPRG